MHFLEGVLESTQGYKDVTQCEGSLICLTVIFIINYFSAQIDVNGQLHLAEVQLIFILEQEGECDLPIALVSWCAVPNAELLKEFSGNSTIW